MKNVTEDFAVVYVAEPTLARLRAAAQSLAGRDKKPFMGWYHGLIGEKDVKNIFGEVGEDRDLIPSDTVAGSGISFQPVPFLTGALVFSRDADPFDLVLYPFAD